ncbi:2-dehydropantoate 2-reductase [Stakelama marina]|uniref:2-dehydropantoate 2-reductase n=1 Tax=Stakelama marina TaxID=2826939 RepID=A0A8T4IGG4_9SPHN|nr:2-dehydropantoate 2-reductase [Stakelama marina]MBR0553571.1 2-dehydropantoate 2-reductase [Stakelama marina]
MTKVAIIGPGAIGGTIAAWLIETGHDVQICARSPFAHLHLSHPNGTIDAAVTVRTRPEETTPVDIVISATKTYDSAAARQWLTGLLHDKTILAIFQNGVEHRDHFAGSIAPERMAPAIVDIPAERHAAGDIVQRRSGTITLADDDAGDAVMRLFENTPITASVVRDLTSVAWRKLALNCAGIVNAITGKPAGVAHQSDAARAKRMLTAECVSVGRAEGADLPDTLPDDVVDHYRKAPPDSINSIHADFIAGRAMEIDARNGVIVRLGRKHGIATPANELAIALLNAAASR